MAKSVLTDLWKKDLHFVCFIVAAHHVFPLATSIGNLWLNDQYFTYQDQFYTFWSGIVYVPVNYIGFLIMKKPLYPWPGDWGNAYLSFTVYFL